MHRLHASTSSTSPASLAPPPPSPPGPRTDCHRPRVHLLFMLVAATARMSVPCIRTWLISSRLCTGRSAAPARLTPVGSSRMLTSGRGADVSVHSRSRTSSCCCAHACTHETPQASRHVVARCACKASAWPFWQAQASKRPSCAAATCAAASLQPVTRLVDLHKADFDREVGVLRQLHAREQLVHDAGDHARVVRLRLPR
jgi:hypothetical protein